MKEAKNKPNPSEVKTATPRKKIFWIVIGVVFLLGLFYYIKLERRFVGPVAWVYIPGNATVSSVRDSLVKSLGSDFGNKVADVWSGDLAKAHGAYRIQPGEPVWRIARMIGTGNKTPIRLTFNNIRTVEDLATVVGNKMEFSAEDFTEALDSMSKVDNIPFEHIPAYLFPDTYELYWSDRPDKVINKIKKNFTRFWTEDRLHKAEELGLTPIGVAIIASIVEEESQQQNEYPTIARLYINRLHIGMPLQSDPTVKYAHKNFAARRVTNDMLDIDSKYNTYRYAGLPPGPIRFVEKTTLDAVLNPADNNYIFMCARSDLSGLHEFTDDYQVHRRNATAYRKALDDRNIR